MRTRSHNVNEELGDIRSRVPHTQPEISDTSKAILVVGFIVMIVLFALSVSN
jgi:hypothetical protein